MVGRPGRDVDRDVADQPHAALVRVAAQRAPLALEADLVGDRAAAREARPVLDPARLALAEVELLVLRHRRRRLGQQAGPRGERRGRLVGRAVAVGRAERQHLPPRLAGVREPVDPRVRLPAEAPSGQRGGMELHACAAGQLHRAQLTSRRLTPALSDTAGPDADAEAHPAAAADPHPVPPAGRRRRPLSGEAHDGRRRRGLVRRLPRRPREAARGRRVPPRRRPQVGRGGAAPARRAPQRRPLGRLVRRRQARAAGSSRSTPGPISSPPGATSCSASSRPASTSSRASSARAPCCSRTSRRAPRAATAS